MNNTPELSTSGAPNMATHTTMLLRELFALANNNSRFQRGKSDAVAFDIAESDRVDDIEAIEDVTEYAYSYSAQRERTTDERPVVTFEFAIAAKRINIPLPDYMIESAIGIEAAEMGVELPCVTLENRLKFTIANNDRYLNVCESQTYFDEDEEAISHACSCISSHDGVLYLPSAELEDQASTSVFLIPPRQIPSIELRQRLEHETISVHDIDDGVLNEWACYESVISNLETETYSEQLVLARKVLVGVKKALYTQAGIKVA